MNIGIIKFGGVINENKFKVEGGNKELTNFIDIMSKEHNVYIISKLDKKSKYKPYNGEKINIIFAYNGQWSRHNTSKFGHKTLMMFENYTYPSIEFLNKNKDIPWVFMNSDIKYKIETPTELEHLPEYHIGLYNNGNIKYEHFDKIHCYGYQKNWDNIDKEGVGIIMNDTHNHRTKKLMSFISWCKHYNINFDVKGKYKKIFEENTGQLKEDGIFDYLKTKKYGLIIASDKQSTTQKIWEYIANDVIVFLYDYDTQYNNVSEDSFLRVIDEIDFESKIELLEKSEDKYKEVLEMQREMLKDSYISGEFILEHYNNLIEKVINK